jgi:hypothetical protein
MRELIRDVHLRIDQFAIGRAETLSLQGSYDVIGGGSGWTFAKVSHQSARERMVATGVRAAVELFGERDLPSGKRFFYAVWRRSEYIVGFPVARILQALNAAEGYAPVDAGGWGGADNVGGSPRAKGSALAPADVERIVNDVLSDART